MGDKSKIEWTDATWNPIVGCSVISPGCTNCYAMKMAARIEAMSDGRHAAIVGARGIGMSHYTGTTQPSKAGPVWTGKLVLAPEDVLTKPLSWKRPRKIFVNSMGDLFHENVPDEWIDRVFAVMALCPQHTFQVLTKRAERMCKYLSGAEARVTMATMSAAPIGFDVSYLGITIMPGANMKRWPLPNVWLGVSAEDQTRADERIPHLLETPAAIRFVSAEPLLGPINFENIRESAHSGFHSLAGLWVGPDNEHRLCDSLDWIIVGGESGPNARPMHPDWARSIRDQCQGAGVPFFFKQWGEWAPGECAKHLMTRTEQTAEWFNDRWHFGSVSPATSQAMHIDDEPELYRFGKSRSFRMLDGCEHNEIPERDNGR